MRAKIQEARPGREPDPDDLRILGLDDPIVDPGTSIDRGRRLERGNHRTASVGVLEQQLTRCYVEELGQRPETVKRDVGLAPFDEAEKRGREPGLICDVVEAQPLELAQRLETEPERVAVGVAWSGHRATGRGIEGSARVSQPGCAWSG